ncbi:MAG: hypothetical protein DRN68_05915 [Thaumarchaeota archaeon]|nr:MAG: hypothetical protein DRN68_05915 [Nitrososphaerota archaeon]
MDFPIVRSRWSKHLLDMRIKLAPSELRRWLYFPPPEYILRYAKEYKPRHPPDLEEKGELLTEETLTLFQKRARVA